MAPRPTKRQKRTVLHPSDDEDEEANKPRLNTLNNYLVPSPKRPSAATPTTVSPSPSPVKKLSLPNRNTPKRSKSTSANGSPEKAKNKVLKGELSKTANLKTLFSKQAEKTPSLSQAKKDDIVSDPISDDDDAGNLGDHRAVVASRVGQNVRKRFRDGAQQNSSSAPPKASQRFVRPSRPQGEHDTNGDRRPWSERFGPASLGELAVHKRKVADVRRWLEDVMAGRLRQRLLILKGAAGTGKTSTVRLLANELGCELLEWRNPTGSLGAHQGSLSASAQFEEFMGRSNKFSQLDFDSEDLTQANTTKSKDSGSLRKIVLIEEFPNTFAKSSTALTSFRNTVINFLVTNTPSLNFFGRNAEQDHITPVIMVISETLLATTSASADSFTAHRLLGPEIIRHPGSCIIEFNAIAPTILAGALELIVQKEARKSGRRRTPGPLVLKRLGDIGDIRSAISSLEFLCLKGDSDADWGSKVVFTKPKRATKTAASLTQGEAESLELISQREASLGIFHAVGKIVYNRREEEPMGSHTPQGRAEIVPDFLAGKSRPKRSEVALDRLMDETGTDMHTFVSALHENYALSCEPTGPADTRSSLDYINGCIDYLSDSDLLCPSWDVFFGGRGGAGSIFAGRDTSSHVLRQDEIAFQVATRGLLFSLPTPVKRSTTGSKRGHGDSHKMYYPTSLKLWREKEELEGLVDYWATILLRGDSNEQNVMDGASAFKRPTTSLAGGWAAKHANQQKTIQPRAPGYEQDQEATPLLALGSSARRELLLDRLPYVAHLARRRKSSYGFGRIRDIERVVSFTGIGDTPDEEAAEGDREIPEVDEAWATDKPTEESSPRKKTPAIRQRSGGDSLPERGVLKLVLSDDDIEDD